MSENVTATDSNEIIMLDETLPAIIKILETVGLDEDDRYGFARSIVNTESYFGSVFEWTERSKGTRFYIYRNTYTNTLSRIEVAQHGLELYSQATVDAANTALKKLLGN